MATGASPALLAMENLCSQRNLLRRLARRRRQGGWASRAGVRMNAFQTSKIRCGVPQTALYALVSPNSNLIKFFRFNRRKSSRRWRGRVLFDKVLPLQFGPKLRRDRRLHRSHIGKDLRRGTCADDQGRGDVRRRRELKSSGSEISAE